MEDKALGPHTLRIETGTCSHSFWRDYHPNTVSLPCLVKTLRPIQPIFGNGVPSTKRIAALSAEANEENPNATEESPIELLTKEIAALKAEMKCF
jgi:hypothetical protein